MTNDVLLIDQGNTRLKWIRARDRELLDETAGRGDFSAFTRACGDLDSPDKILLASVVGNLAGKAFSKTAPPVGAGHAGDASSKTAPPVGAGHAGDNPLDNLVDFCRSRWKIEPKLMRSPAQGSEVRNGYMEPAKLGIDRWLAILGAVAHYGKPVVIWDLGTATTIDAVDEKGLHIGGMIYPGPSTMLNSLGRDTKLKVPDDLSDAAIEPGRSTASCIENGVFAAQVGALNQFMRAAPESIGSNPKLVVTGGAAGGLVPLLDFPCIFDPWLVFRGMLTEGIR